MEFINSYKRLEKLCNEIYDSNHGISAYIDDMAKLTSASFYVFNWNDDLKQLKHYRWIRNQIAHEPNCTEENMCEYGDAQWIDDFYDRIMNQSDPLAMYRKATKPRPTAKTKQHCQSPQLQHTYLVQSVSSKKKVRKATGWIVLLIIAAFVGLFFVLKYDALPNATFIGFTGTPVSIKDRNTREVFGDYIDIYDMTQAVEDGATRPVYYESRVIHLKLDQNTLRLIDATYDALEQMSDSATIEKSKKMLGQMESVLGADATIQSLCEDIVTHYEQNRANLLTGKAMIVAYSRPIAIKIYRKILELRPTWKEKVAVVMTGSNKDPEDWKDIIGTKAHKEELARRFKDNDDPLKIAIVVDMWLTGFDVPSLATMYVYKPMHGYNLMQAVARVNRVFKDKEGGLIVDYVGIASALKEAMKEYSARDRQKYGDMDIGKTAYPKFQEKLQVCRDLFHGYDFSKFYTGTPLEKAQAITGGVNFVLDAKVPKRKELFAKEALLLRQAQSLCSSMTTEEERHTAAYFEAVRSTVMKITMGGGNGKPLSLKEINSQISDLLKASIQSEGVINLFESAKMGEKFSLFDPSVLEEIARMKEKNIVVEILRKLMAEQIAIYKCTNVVQATTFSEKITLLMNTYYNGLITNEEVIKELLKTAEEINALRKEGEKLGLTEEELAFYDALTKPEHIKDFYENETLIALTRELTEMLRKNRTIDWQKKETARAGMRKMVKRLLKKYKYPPEKREDAIETVMSQCELWTDNMAE